MKVLFAVSNEDVSKLIVKSYQKQYKEIISYKNVYYFNAILKEIQRDKSYDRIVISEDLEPSTNSNYQQMDKFIYDRLDSISDEAFNIQGKNIPIILLCADRRTKGEELLNKLFSIGVYDALIGTDREVDEVCALINRPRSKKEAKEYYRLDGDTNGYTPPNGENEVSEVEIQNILAHYKRIGSNEEKYVESFDNIALQYNDVQLKMICQFLPINVKAVLEEKSAKYQQIMAFDKSISKSVRIQNKNPETSGTVEKLLTTPNSKRLFTEDVVIPSTIKKDKIKKLTKPVEPVSHKNNINAEANSNPIENVNADVNRNSIQNVNTQTSANINPNLSNVLEETKNIENTEKVVEEPKRGRGRPKKVEEPKTEDVIPAQPKKRGRPPKKKVEEVIEDQNVIPGFESTTQKNNNIPNIEKDLKEVEELLGLNDEKTNNQLPGLEDDFGSNNSLPGFEDDFGADNSLPGFEDDFGTDNSLPGFEDNFGTDNSLPGFEDDFGTDNSLPGFEDDFGADNNSLPGFEDDFGADKNSLPGFEDDFGAGNNSLPGFEDDFGGTKQNSTKSDENKISGSNNVYDNMKKANTIESKDNYNEISKLLNGNNKIVSFVGTSKNGTSFILNNLAELLSSQGVDVAILDTTRNKNSYYIFTNNDERMRKTASTCIDNLTQGIADGIRINNNLTLYTSVPNEDESIENVAPILETLLKNHTLILIDTDFKTPMGYFENSQEIYLVQSMDVLTIQPLTAFLRDMKAKDVLQEHKIKIILNKYVKLKSAKERMIIGGMSRYNDPGMTFMTELFNPDTVKYLTIPFDEECYVEYLNGLVENYVSLKRYSKKFIQPLKQLASIVSPVNVSLGANKKQANANKNNNNYGNSNLFSNGMNDTLQQMKKKL